MKSTSMNFNREVHDDEKHYRDDRGPQTKTANLNDDDRFYRDDRVPEIIITNIYNERLALGERDELKKQTRFNFERGSDYCDVYDGGWPPSIPTTPVYFKSATNYL